MCPVSPSSAGGRERDTRRAAYKDYDRSARLCCVTSGPATWNSLPVKLWTLTLSIETFHTKTQKSSLWLLAPLRTLSNWRYITVRSHSFIQSQTPSNKTGLIAYNTKYSSVPVAANKLNIQRWWIYLHADVWYRYLDVDVLLLSSIFSKWCSIFDGIV